MAYALACIVIVLMASGQLLFKRVGMILSVGSNFYSSVTSRDLIVMFGGALLMYFVATVLWVLVLRELPLNKAYPFMALSFVLVPLFSHFYFGDSLNWNQLLGSALIVGGMVLSVR